jgi:hypothetical protein
MSLAEKYIVVPFKRNRAGLVPGEMRQASNGTSAEKIASAMSSRSIGVGAYSVMVDSETGDMSSPKLLVSFGEVGDLTQD